MRNEHRILRTKNLLIIPPEGQEIWNSEWTVKTKADEKIIGKIFVGVPKKNGNIKITCDLDMDSEFQYEYEAVNAISKWIYKHDDVYTISIQLERNGRNYSKFMKKLRAEYKGKDEDKIYFSIEKPDSMWMFLYLCTGVIVGFIFGARFGQVMGGVCIGVCLGVAVGTMFDRLDKKHRTYIKEQT